MAPASYNVRLDPNPSYVQVPGLTWKVEGLEVVYPPLTEAERQNGALQRAAGDWKGQILVNVTVYAVSAQASNYSRIGYLDGMGRYRRSRT